MSEGHGSGEIDGEKGGAAGGGDSRERAVGDARAESEVEVVDGGVAAEDGGEEVGSEGFDSSAVAGFDGVEGFADEREGFQVERGVR